jgi:ABC-type transport system involved in cytochrome bd biosynthesis fused ATPase/permease subunit
MPKLFKMLSLLIYVFSIILTYLVDYIFIYGQQNNTTERDSAVALIFFFTLLVLRPFINWTIQKFYFSLKIQSKDEVNG